MNIIKVVSRRCLRFSPRGRERTHKDQKQQPALTSKLLGKGDQDGESQKQGPGESGGDAGHTHIVRAPNPDPEARLTGLVSRGGRPLFHPAFSCGSVCSSSALVPGDSFPLTLLRHFWPVSPRVPDCESHQDSEMQISRLLPRTSAWALALAFGILK